MISLLNREIIEEKTEATPAHWTPEWRELMENTNNRKKPAISAKRMIIPAVIAMLIMHALIVFNTVRINNMGQVISQFTQRILPWPACPTAFPRRQISLPTRRCGM